MLLSASLRSDEPRLNVRALKERLHSDGTVMIGAGEDIFTGAEWNSLESWSGHARLPYEDVLIGDAGEPNRVAVGRLMTDVDRPRIVNHDVAEPMLKLLGSQGRMTLFRELIDAPELHLRRAQINRMHAGSFIGRHVDQDSNPDYSIAIVLQMGSAFTGGEFIVYPRAGEPVILHPTYRSVTISRCDFAHEVRPVLSGVRTSLVYFVAEQAAENRRYAAAAA